MFVPLRRRGWPQIGQKHKPWALGTSAICGRRKRTRPINKAQSARRKRTRPINKAQSAGRERDRHKNKEQSARRERDRPINKEQSAGRQRDHHKNNVREACIIVPIGAVQRAHGSRNYEKSSERLRRRGTNLPSGKQKNTLSPFKENELRFDRIRLNINKT